MYNKKKLPIDDGDEKALTYGKGRYSVLHEMIEFVETEIDVIKSIKPIPNTPEQIYSSGRLKAFNVVMDKLKAKNLKTQAKMNETKPKLNDIKSLLDGAKDVHQQIKSKPLDDGQEGKGLLNDPFIQKHLKIIMDKTADANIVSIIEKMWGGLEMASVEHFMQTGKVNGSFHLRLKELMYHFAERWHNTAALPGS